MSIEQGTVLRSSYPVDVQPQAPESMICGLCEHEANADWLQVGADVREYCLRLLGCEIQLRF